MSQSLRYGPVPDNYQFYIAFLKDSKSIFSEEVFFGENAAEKIISTEKPDLSIFSDLELQTLLEIKKYFEKFSAKKISEFSHEEIGYVQTKNAELISYLYAKDLRF